MKDTFNDKDPEAYPDTYNHSGLSDFNEISSISEESIYLDDMLNRRADVFSGPKDVILA